MTSRFFSKYKILMKRKSCWHVHDKCQLVDVVRVFRAAHVAAFYGFTLPSKVTLKACQCPLHSDATCVYNRVSIGPNELFFFPFFFFVFSLPKYRYPIIYFFISNSVLILFITIRIVFFFVFYFDWFFPSISSLSYSLIWFLCQI
jgi:hypothetical protein